MNNREKLVQCAVELFYKKGYDAVGVQEIVDAAGVTKPTLYHYFGSKYGLLEQAVHEKYQLFHQDVRAAMSESGDLVQTLQNVARAYINGFRRDEQSYMWFISMMYAGEESASYTVIRPVVREQFREIRDIFLQHEKLLGNMRGRQDQYALGFIGLLHHYIYYRYLHKGEEDRQISESEIYEIVHQFLYGIFV